MSKAKLDTYLNDRLDWNLLRTFLAIARERSISRAATRLHLTQPVVSQALKRLEDQLGLQLIDRQANPIDVTRAGEEVRQIAEEVYGTISRLSQASGEGGQGIAGMVRVAIVSGLDFPEYDAFLGRFHRDYPRIELECQEMRSADVVRSLELRTATLGLSPKRALPKKIAHRLFLRQRYALFCGQYHPLFGKSDVLIADLAGEKFVSFTGDKIGDPLSMLTFFRDEMGLTGPVVGSSSSMWEVRRLIVAGFGIGCLPEHVAQDDVEQGRLQRLPPKGGVADVDMHLLWLAERKFSAAEAAFLEALHRFIDARYPETAGHQ